MITGLFTCAFLNEDLHVLPSQESFPLAPGISVAINLKQVNKIFLLQMGDSTLITIEQPGNKDGLTFAIDKDITTLPAFFQACKKKALAN